MKYKLISDCNITSFEKSLNESISEGWGFANGIQEINYSSLTQGNFPGVIIYSVLLKKAK